MDKLKPCRVCGNEANLCLLPHKIWCVECDRCGNIVLSASGKEAAINKWNERMDNATD